MRKKCIAKLSQPRSLLSFFSDTIGMKEITVSILSKCFVFFCLFVDMLPMHIQLLACEMYFDTKITFGPMNCDCFACQIYLQTHTFRLLIIHSVSCHAIHYFDTLHKILTEIIDN